MTLVRQYIALYFEQALRRAFARAIGAAPLSEEEEDVYVEQFEALWTAMSDDDHEAVEAFLAQAVTPSAEELVDIEDHGNVPRRTRAA